MGRRYPLNVILLGVLAALYGVIIGIISVFYTTESVLLAAGITCITVFVVTAFAFWTNIDFTKCIGFICVLGELLFINCLIPIFLHFLLSAQGFSSLCLASSLSLWPGVAW